MHQGTVAKSYTEGLFQAAEGLGMSMPTALKQAYLANPERVPLLQQHELWRSLSEVADQPAWGLKLGRQIQAGHLDVMGFLVLSSELLGDALDCLLHYYPLAGQGGDFELTEANGRARLTYRASYEIERAARIECVMGCFLQIAQELTRGTFKPLVVGFEHNASEHVSMYEAVTHSDVHFRQSSNYCEFDAELLNLRLCHANESVNQQMRAHADESLKALQHDPFISLVQLTIRQQPQWKREELCDHLELNSRQLNRRLAAQGTSFKHLQAKTRQALTEELIKEGVKTDYLVELFALSDESAFFKAYRRWSGRAFSEAKRQLTK